MSSTLYKNYNGVYVNPAICFVVQTLQEKLAATVRQKMDEQKLSTHDVARQSGNAISHMTVWNILNANVKDVKASTLRALAKGLNISEEEMFAAARDDKKTQSTDGKLEEEIGVMFYGWDEATDEAKAETIAALRMIAESFQRRRTRKSK